MQLFILDKNPTLAVHYLADCHVIKLCLETAQILSGVIIRYGGVLSTDMPKPQNINHPVIEAIDTNTKVSWVLSYFESLLEEYSNRFGRKHKYDNLLGLYFSYFPVATNTVGNCLGLACIFTNFITNKTDIVDAHRDYYRFKKSIIKRWKYTNCKEPNWLS